MTKEERAIYDLLVALGENIIKNNGEAVDLEEVVDRITELLNEDALQGEKQGAEALKLLADENIAKEILKTLTDGDIYVSEALSKRIATRADSLVKGYSDHTQQVVKETLAGSEELSASEIKTRLAQVLPRSRAEVIARNETVYAIKSGRLEQDESLAEKYGFNVRLVWRTSGDSKVCPICAAMAGETVDLGRAFNDTVKTDDGEVLGWEHTSWNDNGRIPDAHVNCRCYFDEVLV